MPKYGIIVDLDRCTGCMTCVIACKQENLTLPAVWWNKILELENETHITRAPIGKFSLRKRGDLNSADLYGSSVHLIKTGNEVE